MKLITQKNQKVKDIIKNPKYIYDFETDTSTDIHKPNHVEIDILKIDEGHTYESCLKEF